MNTWQLIDKNTPRDGRLVLCAWIGRRKPQSHVGEDGEPTLLRWKTNPRNPALGAYFGDPEEMDDEHLAAPENAPTHWHPIEPLADVCVSGGPHQPLRREDGIVQCSMCFKLLNADELRKSARSFLSCT